MKAMDRFRSYPLRIIVLVFIFTSMPCTEGLLSGLTRHKGTCSQRYSKQLRSPLDENTALYSSTDDTNVYRINRNETHPAEFDEITDDDSNIEAREMKMESIDEVERLLDESLNIDYMDLVSDGAIDQSIEKAVQQLINYGPEPPKADPTEIFQQMYKDLKASKGQNRTKLDPAEMLKALYPPEVVKDPFDERVVITKLRRILAPEDFKGMFDDSAVGDLI